MNGFKFLRGTLSPIFKFWYRPKVSGKENILKEGSIILAGNHIHIMDQCNVIVSTKRNLHYMAKKEYFDNKKVVFMDYFFLDFFPKINLGGKTEAIKNDYLELK